MSVVSVPDGSTDGVYLRAQQSARAGVRNAPPQAILPDASGSTVIEYGGGDHVVSVPDALLGREAMTRKAVGLHLKGQGSGITNVILDVRSPCALMSNHFWQNLTVEGMTLIAGTPGCTGLAQYSDQSAQRTILDDVVFEKFTKPVAPIGAGINNNNSEWVFRDTSDIGTTDDGAFLFIGTDGSDQFLNFKWEGIHRHWGTSAPLIDAAKGGHFSIEHLDASNWGRNKAAKLFNLRGGAHYFGVCSMKVNHLRAEIVNAAGGLLYSEWPIGNIVFDSVDLGSQVMSYVYGETITLRPPQGYPGAQVGITNSTLVGKLGVYYTGTPVIPAPIADLRNVTYLAQTAPFVAPPKAVRAENCYSYANSRFTPIVAA